MNEMGRTALLIGLLLGGFGLSVFLSGRSRDWLPRRILAAVAGLLFLGNAFVNPEQRYISLFFVILAALSLWRSFRQRPVRS